MTPELALQKAVRARLITGISSSMVPAASILDRNQRPAPSPSIVIGEGHSVDEGNSVARVMTRVYLDLHIWKREPSTEGVKAIAGAIRVAIKSPKLSNLDSFHFADCYVQSARFLRDPDGETSHAVVTINALVQEIIRARGADGCGHPVESMLEGIPIRAVRGGGGGAGRRSSAPHGRQATFL